MGFKIVIPTEYQRVNKISLRAMPPTPLKGGKTEREPNPFRRAGGQR